MTALDDFVAEHDRACASCVLPSTSACDRRRRGPRSRRARSSARCSTGSRAPRAGYELIELAESIRLDEQVHTTTRRDAGGASARGAARYLDLVKGGVLDEHYLENEVRIELPAAHVPGAGKKPDPLKLRDPRLG